MNNNVFESLQEWYSNECDGDWEHEFGIKIDTLDNPGWTVEIDIKGTELENRNFEVIDKQRNDDDWIQCQVVGDKYRAAGGPRNLTEVIEIFIAWKNENGKK